MVVEKVTVKGRVMWQAVEISPFVTVTKLGETHIEAISKCLETFMKMINYYKAT